MTDYENNVNNDDDDDNIGYDGSDKKLCRHGNWPQIRGFPFQKKKNVCAKK